MHATTWINLENMCYVEEARTKGHLLSESMYTKRPEQGRGGGPRRQRVYRELLFSRAVAGEDDSGL